MSGRKSPDYASLHPGYESTRPCVARRAKHPSPRVNAIAKNIPLYRNSETAYMSPQPGPRKRGVSRSSRTRAGRRWTLGHIGAKGFAGRATVSEDLAHTTGVIGVRQNRVVLAPGVCAPSLAVMRRSNRARASAIRKATGAIVHRSPGRARHKPFNHCAGKAGCSGCTCMPLCSFVAQLIA